MSSAAKCAFIIAALFFGPVPLLSARTGALPVTILVEGSGGEVVADVYVALVPAERPWSRPAVEKIGTDAKVLVEVAEGTYRIVAGARGKGVRVSDRIEVRASGKNEFRVALPVMRTLTGSVRNERGEPLPDVTIGDVNAFVEPPLGTASELAAIHLGRGRRTKSDADGNWSLLVEEARTSPLVAEAADYATTWRSRQAADFEPIELVMQRGARLRLLFDREAPEVVVTLEAKGDLPAVPPAWQSQFWARRVLKNAIEWASLAAGEYDIYAQQFDLRTFSGAVKIGTASLESGVTAELRLQLPQAKAPSKSVAMNLVPPLVRFDAATIKAFGRDGRGTPRSMPLVSEQVSGGTLLYLDATGFMPPYFGTTDDRFIVLPVAEGETAGLAAVRDLAGASLRIQAGSEGLELPSSGMATFLGCSTPETIAVPVAVAKDGRVTFDAPAGCMRIVLDFDPFSPVVLMKQLSPGDPEWLGEFTLYAGGSAAVRVATEDGSPVASATVVVSARSEGGRTLVPIAEQTTGPDGWARFERLPAGPQLAVGARTSDGDRSVIENLRVDPQQQKFIDPLRMPRPANLVVEPKLAPEFTRQFPKGHILMLFLEPIDGSAERRTVRVEGSERVEFSRLLPGRWQLGAMITADRGYQPVLGEQIEVKAGESKEVEALIEPLVFRGRVTGSASDLSGNIDILSPRRSDLVPSVEVFPSGEFVTILPRRDTYFVDVRLRSTGQLLLVGNVAFLDPAQPVEIKLPQGVIVARVRAGGKPVAGAMVMARMRHQPSTEVPLVASPVKTGTDGEARIEGLLPGQWVFFVAEDAQSQKSVTVSGNEVESVELEVTGGSAITGRVMETFGAPVADAKVTCLLPGPDGLPYIRKAFTGHDGSFDVGDRVRARSTVLCSVTSFSGAQGYRVVAGEPANLVLPANPAALRVTSLPAMDRFSGLWLVSRDGRVIEVSPYVPRVSGGATLDVPALAPDAWKLVRVSTPSEWMALGMVAGTLPGIVDVTLKPDERKTVDVENAGRKKAPGL